VDAACATSARRRVRLGCSKSKARRQPAIEVRAPAGRVQRVQPAKRRVIVARSRARARANCAMVAVALRARLSERWAARSAEPALARRAARLLLAAYDLWPRAPPAAIRRRPRSRTRDADVGANTMTRALYRPACGSVRAEPDQYGFLSCGQFAIAWLRARAAKSVPTHPAIAPRHRRALPLLERYYAVPREHGSETLFGRVGEWDAIVEVRRGAVSQSAPTPRVGFSHSRRATSVVFHQDNAEIRRAGCCAAAIG